MRLFSFLLLTFTTLVGHAQSISSVNFKYWYNQEGEINLELRPVKQNDSIVVFYTLRTNNGSTNSYTVEWEKRDSYNQRVGSYSPPRFFDVSERRGRGKIQIYQTRKTLAAGCQGDE